MNIKPHLGQPQSTVATDWLGTLARASEIADENDVMDGKLRSESDPAREPTDAHRALERVFNEAAAELRSVRQHRFTQARKAWLMVNVAGLISLLTVLIGFGLLASGLVAAAAISWASSALFSITTTLYYRMYRAESKQVDALIHDLQQLADAHVSHLLTLQQKTQSRESAIQQLINRVRYKSENSSEG